MTAMMSFRCLWNTYATRIKLNIPETMMVIFDQCPPLRYSLSPYITPFTVTADSIFSGITTFAKLPWVQCLGKDRDATFDIAFIGAPFVRPFFSWFQLTAVFTPSDLSGHWYLIPSRR